MRRLLRRPHGCRRSWRDLPHLKHAELQGPYGQPRREDLHGLLRDRRRLGGRRKDRGSDSLSPRGGHRMMVEGRASLFEEPNINTDLIMPVTAFRLPLEEQVKQVFASHRPGWAREVREGDVIGG